MFDESLKMQYFLEKIFIDVRKIANICCTQSFRLKLIAIFKLIAMNMIIKDHVTLYV